MSNHSVDLINTESHYSKAVVLRFLKWYIQFNLAHLDIDGLAWIVTMMLHRARSFLDQMSSTWVYMLVKPWLTVDSFSAETKLLITIRVRQGATSVRVRPYYARS